MKINPNCPCQNKSCPNFTKCDQCHKAHAGLDHPVACERNKKN